MYLFNNALKVFLICRKILRHGANGSSSLRRKTCCGFLWPIKIHSPRQSLFPLSLGTMASTLTTRPPRTSKQQQQHHYHHHHHHQTPTVAAATTDLQN
jgi:hypothetical protein